MKKISESSKITLTLNQLKRLVKEAVQNEYLPSEQEDDTAAQSADFDISKAIRDHNYKFEGLEDGDFWQKSMRDLHRNFSSLGKRPPRAPGKPSLKSAKWFGLALYQPSGEGWLNLCFAFDTQKVYISLFESPEQNKKPWSTRKTRVHQPLPSKDVKMSALKRISDDLLEDIRSNKDLEDILLDWVKSNTVGAGKDDMFEPCAAEVFKKIDNADAELWNSFVK